MTRFERPGRDESCEKFARLWFDGLTRFHRIDNAAVWEFNESHVRAFLRSKLEKGMPTWKRIKIVEGLIWYRNRVRKSTMPRLEPLRAKLQEVLVKEKHSEEDGPMEDVVGKIDPREPDVIQEMRRALRLKLFPACHRSLPRRLTRAFPSHTANIPPSSASSPATKTRRSPRLRLTGRRSRRNPAPKS